MAELLFLGPNTPLNGYLQAQLRQLDYGLTGLDDGGAALVGLVSPDFTLENISETDSIDCFERIAGLKAPIQKLLVLSSSSIYGEGALMCGDCGRFENHQRLPQHLEKRRWEALCPICQEMLMPLPIPEKCLAQPCSLMGKAYGDFESMIDLLQERLDYPVVRLRLFDPYWDTPTFLEQPNGHLLAEFTCALLQGSAPQIPEEGYLTRDFVHGEDVVQAIHQVIQKPLSQHAIYNIGSSEALTLHDAVAYLQEFLDKMDVPYQLLETHREGIVRHSIADIQKAQTDLGYVPKVGILEGLQRLAQRVSVVQT